jgi:hypothetical protein
MEARACAQVPFLQEHCSEPARQGTMGHAVLAGLFQDAFAGDWQQASAVVNTTPARLTGLAPWCADAVKHCLAYGLDLVRSYVSRHASLEVLVEQRLDGKGINVPAGGSADLILLCKDSHGTIEQVIVIDWKTGFVSQGEAADHLQLACYAVMAFDAWRPSNGVVVHLAMGRRQEFSSALYDGPALTAVRRRITAASTAAQLPEPELVPSITACRYCKALAFCAAAREHFMTAADQLSLFGATPADRVQLAQAAAIAKRFMQEADALAKQWRTEATEEAQS